MPDLGECRRAAAGGGFNTGGAPPDGPQGRQPRLATWGTRVARLVGNAYGRWLGPRDWGTRKSPARPHGG